ncbi:MAG: hypothetical protein VST72_01730 [Nitrospirota bacterium]|nr:hypothetical protein [Nitrospirota bacterium]
MLNRSDNPDILACPFCKSPIDKPREIENGFGDTFTGGKCVCGAVYIFDRSGHNLGEAYVDGLAYACDGDWDKAWGLIPDEDYEVRELSYDGRRNRFSRTQRKLTATFLFVLLKNVVA